MTTKDKFDSSALSEIIKTRRTVRSFDGESVSNEVISELIEAAIWAPNHRMTEPWRFYVLAKAGKGRQRVAELTYEWTLNNTINPNPERAKSSAEAARQELLDSPALVYVYSLLGDSAEIAEENYSATSCAIQNFMLAAHAKGLGVGWSTGKPTRHEQLGETLGADKNSRIVGCLYVGYPGAVPESHRNDISTVTSWL